MAFEEETTGAPRPLWDAALAALVFGGVFALLALWPLPVPHPQTWEDTAIAAGLRPPLTPAPGLARGLLALLFKFLSAGTVLDLLPVLGRLAVSAAALAVYLVFRDSLPATLRLKVHLSRVGARVGRVAAAGGALLFVCADPVWRAGQTFSSVSLFLLLATGAVWLFFRFLRAGSLVSIYLSAALLGIVCAESTLGFVLLALAAGVLGAAFSQTDNPVVAFSNPLLDDLVRTVVLRRLTCLWGGFFFGAVTVNLIFFVAQDGLAANGIEGFLGALFAYFVCAVESVRQAATAPGWLFAMVFAIMPFIIALKLLPRAWDEDKFLPWLVGVLYAILGIVALSQLAGLRAFWFWTWLGDDSLVPSDTLLAFILVFDLAVVTLSVAVFGIDACCRNYRRIARTRFPESVQEELPARMAQSLAFARAWRVRVYWVYLALIPCVVLPGRIQSAVRTLAHICGDFVAQTLDEAAGCVRLTTDERFDALIELEALRRGRPLVCVSLDTPDTARARALRLRAALNDEDRELLKRAGERTGLEALRAWARAQSPDLIRTGVQAGLEVWRDPKLARVPAGGVLMRPGAQQDEAVRARAVAASRALGDRAIALGEAGVAEIADAAWRRLFPHLLWRLSRFAQERARAADRAQQRGEAARETEWAEKLDAVNERLKMMKERHERVRAQAGTVLTPREGILVALGRLDFALAARYAKPVLEATPDDAGANFAMGMMYYVEEQWSRAEPYLARCARIQPDNPVMHNNLALTLLHLDKLSEAEAHARKALELAPHVPEIQKTLDKVLSARPPAAGK